MSVGFGWGVGGGVGVVTVGRRWGVVLDTLGCWQGVGGVSYLSQIGGSHFGGKGHMLPLKMLMF